jgi:AraC-like DNA-binding protein/quercetin dioxygenase-like cupin family protein
MKTQLRIPQEHVFGKGGFHLDVSTWTEHGDYPAHTHSFSEIAIVLEGTGISEVDGEEFPFHAGDVFVLHGNRPHAYLKTTHLTLINITYDPKLTTLDRFEPGVLPGYQALFVIEPKLRKTAPCKRHLTLTGEQLIQVKALTDILEQELHGRQPGYQLMAVGHFMILVTLLSRFYSEKPAADAHKVLRLGKALSHLEKHFADELDINELARIAHMSRRSFFRAFAEVTGQSPLAYLQNLRVMRAVEMLEIGSRNITETAFECGFQDSNYFSRQFKKIIGSTPSEFQNKFNRTR